MDLSIVTVGKVRERFIQHGLITFERKIRSYCPFRIIEVAAEKLPSAMTEFDRLRVQAKEGEKILRHLQHDDFVIALAIDGKSYSSVALANQLRQWEASGNGHIVFIIGGSVGLSDDVLKRANIKLSFSAMTFPHQLMRLILCEQLWRLLTLCQRL